MEKEEYRKQMLEKRKIQAEIESHGMLDPPTRLEKGKHTSYALEVLWWNSGRLQDHPWAVLNAQLIKTGV